MSCRKPALNLYRERIQKSKDALVATLRLREEIVAAAVSSRSTSTDMPMQALWRMAPTSRMNADLTSRVRKYGSAQEG